MNKIYLAMLLACAFIFFAGCDNKETNEKKAEPKETTNKSRDPIEGNWILVSSVVNGKQVNPKRSPQQFKMFHDGYYSVVMYDTTGNFLFACAGPYEVTGNTYKETFAFHSNPKYINAKDWQKWEMKGDTLLFYGFEKGELADGTDVTEDWNSRLGNFVEKRVRIKRQ